MNSSSSLSAVISPLAAAWLFDRYGRFNAVFASASAVYFLAGLLWFRIDPTRAVADLNTMLHGISERKTKVVFVLPTVVDSIF